MFVVTGRCCLSVSCCSGDCCLLVVGRCLLLVAYCSLIVVCCLLLFVDDARCSLFGVC